MATAPFWGTWRVTEARPDSLDHPEAPLLEDVEFTLKENGDVEWGLPDTQERLPLFDCDTFEVLRERDGFTVVVLLR